MRLARRFLLIFVALTTILTLLSAQQPLADQPGVASSLRLLETWIGQQMAYRGIPGMCIGIVYDQDLIYARGFGYADLARKIPVTTRTMFRMASVTKTFTATAILQLRDDGKLRLDDSVSQYLPWFKLQNPFPDAPPVTIEELLTHTSGLPGEAAFPYWSDGKFPTTEEIMKTLPTEVMTYPPETHWKYSNLGYAIAGSVVAKASGEPYETYVGENILKPLGMTSTSLHISGDQLSRLAVGYLRRKADGTRGIARFTDSKGLTSAANLSSDVEDLAKYVSAHFRNGMRGGDRILRTSTLREMERVHWVQPGWNSGWGLGFGVRKLGSRVIVGHGGWVEGYRTQISFCPAEKFGIIVLTNADEVDPSFYVAEIYSLVGDAVKNAVTPPAPQAVADPSWQRFVGTYHDPSGWDSEIMMVNGKLVLYGHDYPPETDPANVLIDLEPVSAGTFRMTGENGSGELLTFELSKEGNVVRVKQGENYLYPGSAE